MLAMLRPNYFKLKSNYVYSLTNINNILSTEKLPKLFDIFDKDKSSELSMKELGDMISVLAGKRLYIAILNA